MRLQDLPPRWQKRLEQYTDEKYGPEYQFRGTLSVNDFCPGFLVQLRFPDGSQVMFQFAFYIEVKEWREIAVFTEHCGYHIFPLGETEVQLYRQVDASKIQVNLCCN